MSASCGTVHGLAVLQQHLRVPLEPAHGHVALLRVVPLDVELALVQIARRHAAGQLGHRQVRRVPRAALFAPPARGGATATGTAAGAALGLHRGVDEEVLQLVGLGQAAHVGVDRLRVQPGR